MIFIGNAAINLAAGVGVPDNICSWSAISSSRSIGVVFLLPMCLLDWVGVFAASVGVACSVSNTTKQLISGTKELVGILTLMSESIYQTGSLAWVMVEDSSHQLPHLSSVR